MLEIVTNDLKTRVTTVPGATTYPASKVDHQIEYKQFCCITNPGQRDVLYTITHNKLFVLMVGNPLHEKQTVHKGF